MNLVDALSPDSAEYSMLTTFPFDVRFFSEYLSREFSDAGVASPVILMDHDRYQQNLQDGPWQPGSLQGNYYLEPVEVGEVFHPKIAVSVGEDHIDVTVSSANLTLSEVISAAQLGMNYTLDRADAAEDPNTRITQDILSFIAALEEEYVGRDAGIQLARLVDRASWAQEVSTSPDEGARFLHNLTTPILLQVTDIIDDVERVQLAAPFFGGPEPMARIVNQIEPEECELLIDEGATYVDLPGVVEAIDQPVTVRRLEYSGSRWIHAKWMSFQGSDWGGCLFGSPNMTGRALLSSAEAGNLEAGVLQLNPEPSYFTDGPPLFITEEFNLRVSDPVSPDRMATSSYPELQPSSGSTSADFRLEDVFIETESEGTVHLTVVVEEDIPSIRDCSAVITGATEDDQASIVWTDEPDEDTAFDTEGVMGTTAVPATWRNAVIRVKLDDGRVSTYRQVTAEPTPYTRSQHDMLSSGGRDGMQDLIWNLIFMNDPRAGRSLSDSANDIKRRLEEADAGGSQVTDDEDGGSWTIGGTRTGGSSNRSPHLQLKDSLELSKTNLEYFVNQTPDPEYVQEVVDHLENYWMTLEAGYIRTYITDQLPETPDEAVRFDPDKLLDVTQRYYRALHTENLLEKVGRYLTVGLLTASDDHATLLDGEQAFDCLFTHPALLLALDTEAGSDGIPPFYLAKDVHHVLSSSQPIIAQRLLDSDVVTAQYNAVLERYEEGLDQLAEAYEQEFKLPSRTDHAYKTLLYTFWYQELQNHSEGVDLFEELGQFDRYTHSDLEALGEMMLEGRKHLDEYSKLTEFKDGSLNTIVEGIFGDGDADGAGSREQQIEKLARGDYW